MILRNTILTLATVTALAASAPAALAGKEQLAADLRGKSASIGEINKVLTDAGVVDVIVEVATGVAPARLQQDVRSAATRAAAKAQIRSAIDAVIQDVFGAARLANGSQAFARFSTVPAFAAKVTLDQLRALAADPRVVAINYNQPAAQQLDVTLPLIKVGPAYASGARGQGRTIAIIDTGVQRAHPFLGLTRVLAEACILPVGRNHCPNGTNEQIGPGTAEAKGTQSHGTHVAGIAVGDGTGAPRRGVAFRSNLVLIDIFGAIAGTDQATILRAFEHIEDLVITNPALRISAINMSVGGEPYPGHCDSDPVMALLKPVIDSLRSRRVLAAVATGNSGYRSTMGSPACLSSIVSVGSVTRTGVISNFTNISATTDLHAPGGSSLFPADCVVSAVPIDNFEPKCGTSMASPHVAGTIALLRNKAPTATAALIEDALKSTGPLVADTRSSGVYSKRRLRVDLALDRLLNPTAPTNDAFASARLISNTTETVTVTGSNVLATRQAGEPAHGQRTVWWRYRAASAGSIRVSTLGSGIDTILAVYRGSALNNLVLEAMNDNASANELTSFVEIPVVAGRVYRIAVSGKNTNQQGSIELTISPGLYDNFALAKPVTVPPSGLVTHTGNNTGSTKEPGEPNHAGNLGTTSVWFQFTAPVSGPIQIDTNGSGFDTVLAVYTGNSVSALTPIASDDDSGAGSASLLTFNMVAGQLYRVAVVGWNGASGNYVLNFTTPAGP